MLTKIAPKFVISRIIQNSYFAQSMTIAVLQQPLLHFHTQFATHDSLKYYQCRFYSYLAVNSPKPSDFSNQYQQETYDKACQRLKTFRDIHNIVYQLSQFAKEARILYGFVEKQEASSNFVSKHSQTPKQYENDVLQSLEKYNKLMASLEDKPQWKQKVHQDIGKWFHLIHNNLAQSEAKRQIFLKMDRQAYFV